MTWHVDVMSEAEAASLPPAPDGGVGALSTERGNLPLESIRLRATVTGLTAGVELIQGFRNPFDEPLEATFVFPLPDRAAVTALRMEADGRTVEGVLAERGEAREQYERAVQEGKRASIAEEERPGVFTMRVGNIMPAERVEIRLTLAAQLPYADGDVTFRFPLVVAPRYIPGTPLPGDQVGSGVAVDTDAVPDASRISPPVLLPGFPNPIDLSVEVDVDPAGLPLTAVRSSLHVVTVDDAPDGRLRVRLAPGQRADRDFVLRLQVGTAALASTSLVLVPDADAEAGTFVLTVLPPTEAAPARPRDVVLVLDRSGSMGGWKMVAARRAAARIVDTLGSADRFAVLAFDSVIETPRDLPSGLVEASDRHRFRAVEHLAGLDARGGTEMLAPLLRAADLLAAPADPDGRERDRVLVLVTDGQVGNEDQILRRLAPELRGAQAYAVGVDTAVNEGFLRRLAQLGRGRYELVESEDRLDEAMVNIHRRIGAPVVTGLELTPGDGLRITPGTLAPSPLPDLFAGAPVLVTGRYEGPATGRISIRGDGVGSGLWRVSVAGTVSENGALAAVWARARIRDLEDQYVVVPYTAPFEGVAPGAATERLEREIIELSLRYRVLSRFTAFVAVDTRVVNEGGKVHRVTQPVDAPHGWDMFAQPAMPAAMAPMSAGGGLRSAMFSIDSGPGIAASTMPGEARRLRPSRPEDAPRGIGHHPDEIRTLAAAELRRLEEVVAAPAADRARLLSELAARLAEQVARLEQAGADPARLARLRSLAEELAAAVSQADPADIDRRIAEARVVLSDLAGITGTDTPPGRSRAFWRR